MGVECNRASSANIGIQGLCQQCVGEMKQRTHGKGWEHYGHVATVIYWDPEVDTAHDRTTLLYGRAMEEARIDSREFCIERIPDNDPDPLL